MTLFTLRFIFAARTEETAEERAKLRQDTRPRPPPHFESSSHLQQVGDVSFVCSPTTRRRCWWSFIIYLIYKNSPMQRTTILRGWLGWRVNEWRVRVSPMFVCLLFWQLPLMGLKLSLNQFFGKFFSIHVSQHKLERRRPTILVVCISWSTRVCYSSRPHTPSFACVVLRRTPNQCSSLVGLHSSSGIVVD